MSYSTPFLPKEDTTGIEQAVITDNVTGEIIYGSKEVNTTTNTVEYFDANGALLNGTGLLLATQEDQDQPLEVIIGSEEVEDIVATPGVLAAIPAFATFAKGHVSGGAVIYTTDGTAPSIAAGDEVGDRVPDGGDIYLESASELANFQVISYDGVSLVDIDFEYKNYNK